MLPPQETMQPLFDHLHIMSKKLPIDAVHACKGHRLYGDAVVTVDNIVAWLKGHVTFAETAYVLNMTNSKNIEWIECVVRYMTKWTI